MTTALSVIGRTGNIGGKIFDQQIQMSRNHQGHVTQTQNDAIKICGQRSDPRLDRTAHTFCVIWIVNKIYCVIIQCCRQFIRLMAGDNMHLAG